MLWSLCECMQTYANNWNEHTHTHTRAQTQTGSALGDVTMGELVRPAVAFLGAIEHGHAKVHQQIVDVQVEENHLPRHLQAERTEQSGLKGTNG